MRFFKTIVSTAFALASMAMGGSALGQDTNTARAEYDRLRAACGTACDNTVSPRGNVVSCLVWTNLASGLAQAAGNVPATCNPMARDAATVLDNAARECGALTGRAAQLEIDLAVCRNPTPAAPRPTPTRRLVSLPVCMSAPEFGGASLRCVTRDGRTHNGAACRRVRREDITRAGCVCAEGSLAVRFANGRGTFCAAVGPHGEVVRPTGVQAVGEGNLDRRVTNLAEQLAVLTERVNRICTHAPQAASTTITVPEDGAEVAEPAVQVSTDCTEMNRLLLQNFLGASRDGSQMDETEVNRLIDLRILPIRRDVATLRTDVNGLMRNAANNGNSARTAAFRFFAGLEGGAGVYAGMRPTYALIGFQARARVTSSFHLYGEAGILAGTYGVAQIQNITGYALGAGIGASFPIGPTTMTVDLGYAMRTYTDTGIHGPVLAEDVGLFGDYRGRIHGGQLTLSALLYKGLGISASILVSTGDAIVGTDVTGQYTSVGGEVSVLGGARMFWEF